MACIAELGPCTTWSAPESPMMYHSWNSSVAVLMTSQHIHIHPSLTGAFHSRSGANCHHPGLEVSRELRTQLMIRLVISMLIRLKDSNKLFISSHTDITCQSLQVWISWTYHRFPGSPRCSWSSGPACLACGRQGPNQSDRLDKFTYINKVLT